MRETCTDPSDEPDTAPCEGLEHLPIDAGADLARSRNSTAAKAIAAQSKRNGTGGEGGSSQCTGQARGGQRGRAQGTYAALAIELAIDQTGGKTEKQIKTSG
jgi:hypothetical protein